jgi:hypothetical protein
MTGTELYRQCLQSQNKGVNESAVCIEEEIMTMGLVVRPRGEDEFGGGSSDLAWLTWERDVCRGNTWTGT